MFAKALILCSEIKETALQNDDHKKPMKFYQHLLYMYLCCGFQKNLSAFCQIFDYEVYLLFCNEIKDSAHLFNNSQIHTVKKF